MAKDERSLWFTLGRRCDGSVEPWTSRETVLNVGTYRFPDEERKKERQKRVSSGGGFPEGTGLIDFSVCQ